MFGFLKDKLKSAVERFTKKVEQEVEVAEERIEEKPHKVKKAEEVKKEPRILEVEDIFEESKIEKKEEKGFFKKITEKVTTKKISDEQFEDIFQDLQITLLENNVALDVVEKIKRDLKTDLVDKPLKRMQVETQVVEALKKSLEEILTPPEFNLIKIINNAKKDGRPAVILIIGYNGAGKSLSCAKLAHYL